MNISGAFSNATKPVVASAVVYAIVTVIMAGAVVARIGSSILGDAGDPILNAAILAWNAQHIPWTDTWFNFPGFYPATDALTFSEHLLGVSVVSSPLYWVSGNAPFAYNGALLLTYMLSGLAMYALVWRLTGNVAASFLSGAAYAFSPYRVTHLAHIQVLTAFWAPLALLGLHGFLESAEVKDGSRKPWRVQLAWLALFGVSWMLQGAANGYFLVFFSVIIGLWILWFVVLRGRWRDLAMIAAAGILAFLPLAAILVRFFEAHTRYGLQRTANEITMFSADIGSFLCAPPHLTLWSWMTLSTCTNEEELFPGFTVIALCLAGLWIARRVPASSSLVVRLLRYFSLALLLVALGMIAAAASVAIHGPWETTLGSMRVTTSTTLKPFSRGVAVLLLALACSPAVWRAARNRSIPLFYALAAASAWALAWGPVPLLNGKQALPQGPYAWLMLLPGMTGLRVPARFWMMVVLCLSVVMGVVLAHLFRRRSPAFARAAVVVIGCALAIDGWAWIPAANMVPSAPVPDAIDNGLVLTLPLGEYLDFDAQAQLDAVVGGWSSVNGYSGYQPPHYWLLKTISSNADPIILSPFVRRGNLTVVVHERAEKQVEMVERQQGARMVGRRDGLRQFWIPARGVVAASKPAGERYDIAAVSSTCSPNKVEFVLDGDPKTRWECGPQTAGQAITADLGRVVTIGMVVPGLAGFPNDFPREVIVETSVDGVAWDEVRRGEVFGEVIEAMLVDSKAVRMTVAFTPRPARYIRLRLTSTDSVWYWSIAELEVWSGGNGST